MQLRLRTKLTLVMTGLVLLVVAVLSGVFAAQLLDQLLQATNNRANDLASQVFVQAQHALADAGERGLRPASDDEQGIHSVHEIWVARLANGANVAILDTDIRFHDAPVVHDQCIRDDQVRHVQGIGGLAHAVATK